MAEKDLKENPFRDEIFEFLLANGYQESFKADYDCKNALDTKKVFAFLEDTQAIELQKLKDHYGAGYKDRYLELLCQKIDDRGLLTALNEWVEDYASSTRFSLVYFKTSLQSMSESLSLYEKNIFSVRREFAYEDKPESFRVDLALFINGIPIAMIELKKQTAGQKAGFEGTKQFKEHRNPDELIFSFNRRTLVYFALDEFVAFLTTRLDTKNTSFLPFNQGTEDEGAGNPVAEGKHSTYYVWEEILQKDMLLRIIREFMFIDDDGNMIFPRYHQLDAVLSVEQDMQSNGIGGRYLIWHSAGSGKTKTIAWLAKRLINHPDINTVIIISDRTVIDSQLGNEVRTLDGKKGVVQWIETNSKDLLKMLDEGGYIIVTTLQKFRPILAEIKQYKNRNYAIIIDEAHSSAAGKSMSKASEMLTGKSLKESIAIDEAYDEIEDDQNQLIKNKSIIETTINVSYFAFTATPKKETMELFGTRKRAGKSYFHKYSMKQAIEERFILNPLLCYTNYNDKYEIRKKKDDETEYDSASAQAAVLNFVTTSEIVIDTKTQIMMDDFIERRINWLGSKAKAMIITPSRKHAVCYKIAVDKYLAKKGCNFRACAAFSGTIELDGEKFTEEGMNKDFIEHGVEYDLKAIIKNNDDLRIIIVADKLQTGFDENKLCIMYVDKKLGSAVKAVQTLSRINRPAKNKRTFIMDFVNSAEEIKAYFMQYYGGELFLPTENETDPNILFTKRDKLLDYYVFTLSDVEKAYAFIQSGENKSAELTAEIAGVIRAYNKLSEEKQQVFVAECGKYVKLFYYISSVYNLWIEDMKKLAVFLDVLHTVLYEKPETVQVNADELIELVDFSTKKASDEEAILLSAEDTALEKISTEVVIKQKSYSLIDEIIEKFNLKYANADKELKEIVENLSANNELIGNVRDSTPSAYESETMDRISRLFINGVLSDNEEKSAFYAEVSSNQNIIRQLANAVIRRIKDDLLAS